MTTNTASNRNDANDDALQHETNDEAKYGDEDGTHDVSGKLDCVVFLP